MTEHVKFATDSTGAKALIATAVAFVIGAAIIFSIWGIANAAAEHVATVEAAEVLAALSPGDPQTHYALGVRHDETFEPGSLDAAQVSFERAVARSPNSYLLWLQLGRAFEQNGEDEKAEQALARALELAPNYASVKWAYGNLLVRRGRLNEGFVPIREAVAADPSLAAPAAAVAWNLFNGDIVAIREAVGDSPGLNAALAVMLVGAERFDDAAAAWNVIPADIANTELAEQRKKMFDALVAAHRYRSAAVFAPNDIPIGRLTNGNFESAVKADGAPTFEWQIARGDSPVIALSDDRPHSGRYSLIAAFGKLNTSFREISQLVAVQPGRSYTVAFHYKSDVDALRAELKWAVMDPRENARLGDSGPLRAAGEWTARSFDLTVPSDAEGVRMTFVRENCSGASCAISGNIWFDDLTITAK